MVLTNEEQQLAIRRNGGPEFRKVTIDFGTQVFNFDDGGGLDNVLCLSL